VYVKTFTVGHARQGILIYIRHPDEKSSERAQPFRIATNENAGVTLGYLQDAVNPRATPHVVHPSGAPWLSHCSPQLLNELQ
jgi:hypothetical protein